MSTSTPERGPLSHGDAWRPTRLRMTALVVMFLLVVASVIPWRPQAIYSGGADPIVIAKAAIALLTLVAALLLTVHTRRRVPVGLGPAVLIGFVLIVSLLGAVVAGNGPSTAVLVARMLILMSTTLLLLANAPWDQALAALLTAMGIVAVVAAVTGLGTLSEGRLGGGVPEIHPNEVAGLAVPPLLGLVVLVLRRGVRAWALVAIGLLLVIIVATGSRIALVGLAVGTAIAVVVNGIHRRSVLYALMAAGPAVYALVAFTGVVDDLASRGGASEGATALDSRLTGWQVVLAWEPTSWQRWLGVGLSVKEVAVQERWRESQVLDSSWVSLLAQAGVIGVLLVAALVAWALTAAVTARARRGLVLPLLTVILVRSFTESGLIDSAMPFLLFLVLSTVLTQRSRRGHPDAPPPRGIDDARVGTAVGVR